MLRDGSFLVPCKITFYPIFPHIFWLQCAKYAADSLFRSAQNFLTQNEFLWSVWLANFGAFLRPHLQKGGAKNSCNHRCNYFLSNRFPIIRAGTPSFQESWYSPKYGDSPYHQDGCGCRRHHRPYRRRGRAPAPWCSRASWHTP